MTTTIEAPRAPQVPEAPVLAPETKYWTRARKAGMVYLVVGVLAAIFWGILAKHGADSRFTLAETSTGSSVPIPAKLGALIFALVAAAFGGALLTGRLNRFFNLFSGIAIAGIVIAFLCWQNAGQVMPLGSTAQLTVVAALPLILGALGGVLGERSGVINVGIEGQFLTGAFMGAFFGTIAHSAWVGLFAAIVGGVLVSALLAALAIRFQVDQVVLGVLINLLMLGLTSFLYSQVMQTNVEGFNNAPQLPDWNIPGLSKIPVLGPALFSGNIILFATIVLVIAVHVALFHTRWGLRTRAVGEHPTAADTVGIKVHATRYRNLLIAGAITGLGGAYFTIGLGNDFAKNMTNGHGFIALAALIFGRWSPIGSMLAALLFGFADQLGNYLGVIVSPIPSQFLNMLPYAVTILAVAGLVGRVRAPAADGKPYTKG